MLRSILERALRYWRRGDFSLFHLLRHPKILVNYFRYHRQLEARQERITAHPTDLDFEITNACNQDCVQCYRHFVKPYNPSVLSVEDFESVLFKFPYLTNLSLNGFGEPLLNRNIVDIVKAARKRRPWLRVFFHTNGEFLTPDLCRGLVAAGVTRISISMDAATKEVYERIRLGGRWERVTAGLQNLVAAKRAAGGALPLVGVSYSIMTENYGQLPDFVRLVAGAGCDTIGPVRFVSSKWGYRPVIYRQGVMDELARAREVLRTTSLEPLGFPRPEDVDGWIDGEFRDEFGTNEYACRAHWSVDPTVHLAVDGSFLLCCERPYPEEVNLGNFLAQPFDTVWNSPLVRATRRRFYHRTQPSSACEGCGWLTQRDAVLLPGPPDLDGCASGSAARTALGTFEIPAPPAWVRARMGKERRKERRATASR